MRLFHTWRFLPEFPRSWQALRKHRLIPARYQYTSSTSMLDKQISLLRPPAPSEASQGRFLYFCVCDESLISVRGMTGGASQSVLELWIVAIMFCWLDSWFMMAAGSQESCFIVFCYKYIVVVISLLATDLHLKLLNINIYWRGRQSVITFNIWK